MTLPFHMMLADHQSDAELATDIQNILTGICWAPAGHPSIHGCRPNPSTAASRWMRAIAAWQCGSALLCLSEQCMGMQELTLCTCMSQSF